jgi:hypothetical protein
LTPRTLFPPQSLHTILLLSLLLAGCGYQFAGEHISLPEDVHSVSVGHIENRSREQGLEKSLAFALEREVYIRRHFHMEEDPGGGDVVLSGMIRSVRVTPVAFNSNDQAVQFQIAVVLDLTLTRQSDGHVLWQVHGLREIDEYSASPPIVVTSSPQFQRGTFDAANVQSSQLSSIQLAETERQQALARVLGQAARDVYNQMVEGF